MRQRVLLACTASFAAAAAILACVGNDDAAAPADKGDAAGPPSAVTPPGSGTPPSGGDKDAGGSDASDASALCGPTKHFNPASTATLTALNAAPVDIPMQDQYSPRLSADERTIYYSQYPGIVGPDIAPASDIFFATRNAVGDSFPAGTALVSVDTQDLEEDLALTSDGLAAFYATDKLGTHCATNGGLCIARAERPSNAAGFGDAGLVVNNLGDQRYPYFAGNTLYYANRSNATQSWDITTSGGPATLINVNGPGVDTSPVVTPDELVLYFASDRDSDGGGQLAIYMATRQNKGDPFGVPVRVDELSSPRDEFPGFVSADGCRLYLTRDDDVAGGLNLYVASKLDN